MASSSHSANPVGMRASPVSPDIPTSPRAPSKDKGFGADKERRVEISRATVKDATSGGVSGDNYAGNTSNEGSRGGG